jgi:transposase-like protein
VTDERLTLRQAAARFGVSESAIRKRVERRTLRSDKGSDGRRYVYLDTGADAVADKGADTSATGERDALISELRAHNDTLREQLDAERQAHAEARRIIAGLVERIPALEQPSDPTGASEPSPEADHRGTGSVDAEEDRQHPWWRRWLGG